MRYEPAMKEPASPRAIRGGIVLPWPASSPRVRAGWEAGSRQTAELDIWEDDGGTPSGRTPAVDER